MLVILFVIALSLGATMAWFTAEADPIENVFQAGTVLIEAEETEVRGGNLENVNPGDCFEKEFEITNTGTKNIVVRVNPHSVESEWEFDLVHLYDNWEMLGFLDEYGDKPANMDESDSDWNDFLDALENLDDPIKAISEYGPEDLWDLGDDGYFYYIGDPIESDGTVTFWFEVCFEGEEMSNEFQGATYRMWTSFEAIQASNNAPNDHWDIDLYDYLLNGDE